MTACLTTARHRSAAPPTTPLSDLAATATGSLAVVGRRSAAVVAASGLIVSIFGAPASATHSLEGAGTRAAVDTSALTASARAALETAPAVTVPKEATWSFDVPDVTVVVDPPPKPKPKPAPVRPTATAASRSQTRAPAPAPAAAPAPATTQGAPAPTSANGSAIVAIASSYVGVPYLWGGTTPSGFDCSGYTSYVYAQVGITLPRTSSEQRNAGTVVSRANAQPGDLIWSPGHIAIYAGGNLQVDAPKPGGTIQIREIWQSSPTFIRVT